MEKETAVQAYERMLKAKKYPYPKKNKPIKTSAQEIEIFEKKYGFTLSDAYKTFILTYGFVSLGCRKNYYLSPLNKCHLLEQVVEGIISDPDRFMSKENIEEMYGDKLGNAFYFCDGDEEPFYDWGGFMDRDGKCYFLTVDHAGLGVLSEPYDFDQFVSMIVEQEIEYAE